MLVNHLALELFTRPTFEIFQPTPNQKSEMNLIDFCIAAQIPSTQNLLTPEPSTILNFPCLESLEHLIQTL